MTLTELKEKIIAQLRPLPALTSTAELADSLDVAYNTIYRHLMELVADRKIGYIKKGGIKLYYAPPMPEAASQ